MTKLLFTFAMTGLSMLGTSNNAFAKLVENGESFTGSFYIQDQIPECGYRVLRFPLSKNEVLSEKVRITGSVQGLSITPDIFEFSNHEIFHDLKIRKATSSPENKGTFSSTESNYLSASEFYSTTHFRLDERDPLTTIETKVSLNSSRNVTVTVKSTRRDADLVCHYLRLR